MPQHPGTLLTTTLKDHQRTQKQFAILVGKKVSEVNELIKGKRNITIQRDYLLHTVLETPIKYWLNLQIDYDYETFLASNSAFSFPPKTEIDDIPAENVPSDVAPSTIPSEVPSTSPKTPLERDEQREENYKIFRNF
jgi:plasmid maintenance system antidote protein VapI